MFQRRLQLALCAACFLLGSAFAAPPTPSSTPPQTPPNLRTCPALKDLTKTAKLTWVAKGGWKSYDMSFIKKVTSFEGAQWSGSTLGQITCIYAGVHAHAFPVLLVYNTLALQPFGGHWSKNLGGYANCKARKQSDCTFLVVLKPKQNDIYQEAEMLKSS